MDSLPDSPTTPVPLETFLLPSALNGEKGANRRTPYLPQRPFLPESGPDLH